MMMTTHIIREKVEEIVEKEEDEQYAIYKNITKFDTSQSVMKIQS